jgi:hypothetical protein
MDMRIKMEFREEYIQNLIVRLNIVKILYKFENYRIRSRER